MTDALPIGPIARAAVVLRHLATTRRPTPLSRIAHATTLPKSTVHRILSSLVDSGASTRTPVGYTLSPEWSELLRSRGAYGHGRLRRLLTPHLLDLHQATNLVCDLAVREESEVLFLSSIYGHGHRAELAQLPEHAPLHCTAAGQVLLAFDPECAEALAGRPLLATTARTITDPTELRYKLSKVRTSGVAVSRGERVPGTVGIAAPVTCRSGRTVCALSVGGPTDRVDLGATITQLRHVAHAASVTLRSAGTGGGVATPLSP